MRGPYACACGQPFHAVTVEDYRAHVFGRHHRAWRLANDFGPPPGSTAEPRVDLSAPPVRPVGRRPRVHLVRVR